MQQAYDAYGNVELIDSIIEKLNAIFISSAKVAFGTRWVYKNKTKPENVSDGTRKPWFTPECKKARQNYRTAKKYYRSNICKDNVKRKNYRK